MKSSLVRSQAAQLHLEQAQSSVLEEWMVSSSLSDTIDIFRQDQGLGSSSERSGDILGIQGRLLGFGIWQFDG